MSTYSFTVSDHLGNIRVVVDEQGQVQQKNEYTAFGVVQSTDPSKNKYLFNNKELQTGTNYLDYGARMYQPELCRWNVVDPLGEESRRWSLYNFSFNNPLRFIDPDGMMSREVKQGVETGNVSTESVTILVGTEYSDGYSTHNTLTSTASVDILVDNSDNKNINENNSIVIDKGKKAKDNGEGPVGKGKSKEAGVNIGGGTREKTSSFFGVSVHTDPNRSVGYTVPPVGIFIGKDNLYWKMHEYGHYLQYQQLGGGAIGIIPFYLIVGLPSAINQGTGLGGAHDTFFTETDANARAYLYFKNFYDNKTMTNFINLYPLFPIKK